MIVHRDGERLLGKVLPDDVFVHLALDVDRLDQRHLGVGTAGFLLRFLVEDVFADRNATVADVDARPGDQFAHLRVTLSAERAHGKICRAGHGILFLFRYRLSGNGRDIAA